MNTTPTAISKQTIQSLLFDLGVDVAIAAVVLPDSFYSLPAIDWIAGDFAKSFVVWRDKEDLHYARGDTDCDDFVEAAVYFARRSLRRTPGRPKSAGFAFGEFYFQRNGNGNGHAINVAVCRDLDNLRLAFFEPQTASLVVLSRAEIRSCEYVGM